jgi:ABC-type molybdate transport system substrate-binding protein
VIVVRRENPKNIQSVRDLLRGDLRVALGNPDAAAIGKEVRTLLTASGHWAELEKRVVDGGVFKPTVNDVANDVKLGSVDAGIVWDSTAAQYPELTALRTAELDAGEPLIEIAVLHSSKQPTAALRFARYVAARDKGLTVFADKGFRPVEGDLWEEHPELTLFAGAVNRRALEPIVQAFEEREGVTVNTKYDGCGVLTGQMRILDKDQSSGFPDTYMACDVYYLETVKDLFQDAVNVSDAAIVMVVQKGNPKNITNLADLLRPDVRLVLGQPDQCTIGVLSRRLLQDEGIYERLVSQKDIPQKPSSAMLVPDVATGAADAVLAYVTDTRAELDKVDVIRIDSPLAKAVQPFSIARSSEHKYLSRRLFAAISRSRDKFEAAGFHWRLGGVAPSNRNAPRDDDEDSGENASQPDEAAERESL